MSDRQVTERDFRMPEFADAKPEDYEFRGDGKIVRKDRWEQGMFRIAYSLGFDHFEIVEVAERVERNAIDAKRYRHLRDHAKKSEAREFGDMLICEKMDAFVDALIEKREQEADGHD